MLQRKVLKSLIEWKNRNHKCLIVKGQRQVGKTFILEYFGSTEYTNYVRLDMFKEPMARRIFEENQEIDSIIDAISLYKGSDIHPHDTLIILDEIQESTKARSMLKYFSEDGRYDVIASGSLLGVSDSRLGVYKGSPNKDMLPVGGEEHITMYSLDFEEFLLATGVKQKDIDRVRRLLIERERLSDVDVDVFSRRFHAFMVVGGMPEAVKGFLEGGMADAERALGSIRETCINDINRYNRGVDVVKTQQCFESIPDQLSNTNKRFTYSRIDGGGSRSSGEKYMENLLWIMAAGYGNYCRSMTDLRRPVGRFIAKDVFKVYMSDTGMLMNMMGPESRTAIMMGDTAFDFGAVAENAVAEALMKSGHKLYYYRKTNGSDKMELDMVIESDGLIVVEVKKGEHRSYPSLKKTLGNDNVKRRVIFEKGNVFTDEQGIEHYPIFASAFVFQEKGHDPIDQLMEGVIGDPYS